MDSSGDENSKFAWVNASSDSSDSMDSSDSKNSKHNINKIKENGYTNELKSNKRKHSNNTHESNNEIPVKKRIKLEPSSDTDNTKKKHKKGHSRITNEGQSNECLTYDDDYLNMKVKEELNNPETPSHIKTKKKKKKHKKEDNKSSRDVNLTYNEDTEISIEEPKSKSKKKKRHSDIDHSMEYAEAMEESFENVSEITSPRKKKKEKKKMIEYESKADMVIEDKFTAEETIVQKVDSTTSKAFQVSQDDGELMLSNNQFNTVENSEFQAHDSIVNGKSKKLSVNMKAKNSPSILNRITFEDDIESDIERSENINSTFSSKFKHFLRSVPLMPISENFSSNLLFTDNEEVWILKCPHEVNIQTLINKDLNIDNKTKIKINGETYNGSLEEDEGRVVIVSASGNNLALKNLDLKGIIGFKKRLPKPHFVEDSIIVNNQTDFIPLPETKCRHPLFGSDYKKAIKIPISLSQRLTQSNNLEAGTHERKKKKKHKKEQDKDKEIMTMSQTKIEMDSDVPVKKAKKRKHSEWNEEPVKKTKRIKHEPDSSEVWESEKAIEENLFNF